MSRATENLKVMIFLSLLSTLGACGGGGGSGSEGGSTTSTNTTSNESTTSNNDSAVDTDTVSFVTPPTESAPTVIQSTSDLVTTEDFIFSAVDELDITIALNDLQYERAYINLCHFKETQDQSQTIDYSNCVLNTPLKNGSFERGIALGNDITALKMEIWRYDINQEPLSYTWSRENGLDWTIN